MRILIINQPFHPDVVATAQHMADWTQHLAKSGHTVTVIASRSVYGQTGAALPTSETWNGVHIRRVGSNLFKKGRLLTRLLDFGLFHLRALIAALLLPKQDVVVCLTTPPFIGVVGLLVKSLRRSRYIQYEMDLYPDIAVALGKLNPRSLPARIFDRLHRRLLTSADRVIVLGRCMQRVIEAKNIPAKKLALITPWADPDEIRPIPHDQNPFRAQHNLQNKFVVMYAGNLGLAHDTSTLLAAIDHLSTDDAVRFVIVGGGRRLQDLRRLAAEKKLTTLLILDYVPREHLPHMLAAADLHLITQAPNTAGLIVPSKFYGILAAGRPSLYVGPPDTEIARTITEKNVGTVLPIGDTPGFLNAIAAHRATPANPDHIRAALMDGHTRAQCTEKLTALAQSLTR